MIFAIASRRGAGVLHSARMPKSLGRLVAATLTTIAFAACGSSGAPAGPAACPALERTSAASVLCKWTDHPSDPVLAPEGQPITGDPSVLAPEQSPDGQWHLFAWQFPGIVHYASPDGVAWSMVDLPFKTGSIRPNVFKEGKVYHLLFEKFSRVIAPQASTIQMSDSTDLVTWSEPVTLLEPTLPWEMETQSTVGNPFVLARDGEYWLYYSAAGVTLADAGYTEPKYIGLARAKDLRGPYTKRAQPILVPDAKVAWRNLGAGAMKLLADKYSNRWVAMENGIYTDSAGASHSAIQVLESDDGVTWTESCPTPPLAPTGAGWKKAFVYASCTVRRSGELRVYYNGRDGWADGIERIGFSSVTLPCP